MSSIRSGSTGHVSEHRFRVALLACTLALAAMLTVAYSTVEFTPIWAGPAVSAAS